MSLAALEMYSVFVELMAGDADAAESAAREAYAVFDRVGERRRLPTAAALLARSLFAQDRLDEAERYSRVTEEAAFQGRHRLSGDVARHAQPGAGAHR